MKTDPGLRVGHRNLVIVRAGTNSLHTHWLLEPYEHRNFDIIVSYFDRIAFEAHADQDGVFPFSKVGGKWDGIHATLEWFGPKLDAYDYVWMPDDDIDTDAMTINQLFTEMHQHDLSVAQPSLTANSYFTHFLFVNCPGLAVRFTNYVEIMVPCLTTDLLKSLKHHFSETMSGFGLDYIWCRMPESGQGRCAIIDAVAVHHTRPVGKVLLGSMADKGISAKDEEARLNSHYGIEERTTPLAYAAITARGKHFHGPRTTGVVMFLIYLKTILQINRKRRHYRFGRLFQLIRRQFTRKLDFTTLTPKT